MLLQNTPSHSPAPVAKGLSRLEALSTVLCLLDLMGIRNLFLNLPNFVFQTSILLFLTFSSMGKTRLISRDLLAPPELNSQNHRMVGVGRDPCGSSSSTPLPKQGHLQQAAQDVAQVSLGGYSWLYSQIAEFLIVCFQQKCLSCLKKALSTLSL